MGKTIKNISVISYNAFGAPFYAGKILRSLLKTNVRKRFRVIGDTLNLSNADMICLQEIHTYPHLKVLQKKLTNYPYCYYKKFLYGPRGGVVIFSKKELENITYTDFQDKGKWRNKSIVGKLGKRGLLITKIKDEPLYIINTHLTQNSDHDWSVGNRYTPLLLSQLEDVKKALDLLSPKNIVILAGDFNLPKNSPLYTNFLKETKVKDVFEHVNSPTYLEDYLFGKKEVGRIDYIFVSMSLKNAKASHLFAEKVKLDEKTTSYLSDHIGLKAEMTFRLSL